jgi:glycogen synthase kinase 3 beta
MVTDFYVELSIQPELIHRIVPPHVEPFLAANGIDIHNFVPMTPEEMRCIDVPR